MSANFGLSLDIAAGVVMGGGILIAVWLGISLAVDTGLLSTGMLVLTAALLAALWLILRGIVLS
jgi:hypothetical protein